MVTTSDPALPAVLQEHLNQLAAERALYDHTYATLQSTLAIVDGPVDSPASDLSASEEQSDRPFDPATLPPLSIPIDAEADRKSPFRFPATGGNPFIGVQLPALVCETRAARTSWSAVQGPAVALADGMTVPPALPATIAHGTRFRRFKGNGTLLVDRKWREAMASERQVRRRFPFVKGSEEAERLWAAFTKCPGSE